VFSGIGNHCFDRQCLSFFHQNNLDLDSEREEEDLDLDKT